MGLFVLPNHLSSKRRMLLAALVIFLLWGGMVFRLAWIQIISTHRFSNQEVDLVSQAVKQRQQSIVLDTGRGDILDRHGTPFTGTEIRSLVIFPLARSQPDTEKISKLAEIIGVSEERLRGLIAKIKEPDYLRDNQGRIIQLSPEQADRVSRLEIPGISAVPVKQRYPEEMQAAQIIGFISQNPQEVKTKYKEEWEDGRLDLDSLVGASGLERSFQTFLYGEGPVTVSYYVDGRGNPLNGLDVRLHRPQNEFYPLSITTTLDYDLQIEVERVLENIHLEQGSAVVLDIESREVLAMASRPGFHPDRVDLKQDGWQNHALKRIPPGSVFKIVVAAAALEKGGIAPDDEFYCSGEYGKYGFSCWKPEGHGQLTLAEAFAESCNVTFAQVAYRLGGENILEYADKLGMIGTVGWERERFFKINNFKQLDGEDAGQVFASVTPSDDEGVLIQTAIGQRDVRITPLQAANMVATIAEGGKKKQVRLVKRIDYKSGTPFYRFEEQKLPGERIEPYTAYQLRKMMEGVVEEGTGKKLQEALWKVAGKSGTAQVSQQGVITNHQWFVGYGPAENPRYAVVVVAENQPVGAKNKAIEGFLQLMNLLAEKEKEKGVEDIAE